MQCVMLTVPAPAMARMLSGGGLQAFPEWFTVEKK
jgi:hypothetical protein